MTTEAKTNETQFQDDDHPGSKGSMKWHQDPTWSVACEFLLEEPETPYTPSGYMECGEHSIGYVWWVEGQSIAVCLNHFLELYDVAGDWEGIGGSPKMFERENKE